MTGWTAKRFWTNAVVEPCEGGFTVKLDSRPVKTPAKAALVLPTEALAAEVAAEWNAQTGVVRPETMPATRAANSAIDKIGPLFAAVVDEVAGFGGSDLLCYRAEGPAELVARQASGWDPLLDWAAVRYAARLNVTTGIVPVSQPQESLRNLRAVVMGQTSFQLAALHDLVAISGSLILGLAVSEGRLSSQEAFDLSRIDEHWQIEQWGEDEIAAASEAARRAAMDQAGRFYALCG